MEILLCYCKTHYNPSLSEDENKFSETSASINAKILYKVLTEIGNVDYIDANDLQKIKNKHYNIVVSINHGYDSIIENITYDKIIYYAVNQHPISRNKILKNFAKENQQFIKFRRLFKLIGLNRFFNSEWTKEYAPIIKNINKADSIICLGNDIVKQSYIDNGYPQHKIFNINYELLKGDARPKEKFNKIPKLLYVGTELCMRKGFDIIYELINNLCDSGYDFELTIIGKPRFAYYSELCKKLKQKLKNKLKYHKLVLKEEYQNIIKNHDFYIFPTIEEGQAGTVLDAMYNGIIPIITKESGVDYSPLGYLKPKKNCNKNHEIIKKIFKLSNDDKVKLSKETADYYNATHVGFEERLRNIFDNILRGEDNA